MGKETSAGVLSQTLGELFRIRQAMRGDGASEAEIARATEQTLRAAWPVTREWKYLCQRCFDYGLVMHDCPGDASCGREKQHLPHEYGEPCWCDKGKKFKKPAIAQTDFTDAGAAPKRSKPTRFGR